MNTTYKTQQCDACGLSEFYDSSKVDPNHKFGPYTCGACQARALAAKRRRDNSDAADAEYRPIKISRCSKTSPRASTKRSSPNLRAATAGLGDDTKLVSIDPSADVFTSITPFHPASGTAGLSPIPERAANTQTAFGKINQLTRHITYLKESINVMKASIDTLQTNITFVKMTASKEKQQADVKTALLETRVSLLEKFILQYMCLTYPDNVGGATNDVPVVNTIPMDGISAEMSSSVPAAVVPPTGKSISMSFDNDHLYDDKLVMQSDGVEFFPHDLWYHDNTCNYGLSAPLIDELPAFEISSMDVSTAESAVIASVDVSCTTAVDTFTPVGVNLDPREILEVAADFLTESESKAVGGTGRSGRFARRTIKKELIKGII